MKKLKKMCASLLCVAMVLSIFNTAMPQPDAYATTPSTSTLPAPTGYWVVDPVTTRSQITVTDSNIVIANSLVERTIDIAENSATRGITTSFRNSYKNWELLSSAGHEGQIGVADAAYSSVWIGGNEDSSLQYAGYENNIDGTEKVLEWTPKSYIANVNPWPAIGKSITLIYKTKSGVTNPLYSDLKVKIRYDIYDGIPVISKKATVINEGNRNIKITKLFIDDLNLDTNYKSKFYVESNYNGNSDMRTSNSYSYTKNGDNIKVGFSVGPTTTGGFVGMPDGTQQPVSYNGGPGQTLAPTESMDSMKAYELLHSVDYYEWQQIEIKKMYDKIAPWTSESPLYYHLLSDNVQDIKNAVDVCAELGFDAIIQSFGSGLDMESTNADYIRAHKEAYDYAHSKGIQIGGYTLAEIRDYSAINSAEARDGDRNSIFRCMDTDWADNYFNNIKNFMQQTGADLIEMDGPYGMYTCDEANVGTTHQHDGIENSIYKQWKEGVLDFFGWCKQNNLYVNAPDWMYLCGANQAGIGYEEIAWSQPRQEQNLYARIADYKGTYVKKNTMGWSFLPLIPYHGGGAAASYSPLQTNLSDYDYRLAGAFATGVLPCIRGNALYESDDSKAVVKKWVDYYKKYKAIINSETIHVKPPQLDPNNATRALGMDVVMHANSQTYEKGMITVFNQTDQLRTETITIPMYYTGLTNLTSPPMPAPGSDVTKVKLKKYGEWPPGEPAGAFGFDSYQYPQASATNNNAVFMREGISPKSYNIDSNGNIQLKITLKPMSYTWFAVYSPNDVNADNNVSLIASKRPVAYSPELYNTKEITDGSTDTNNYSTAYMVSKPEYVTYDLGSVCDIRTIQLWHYYGDTRSYHDVIVQASNSKDSGYVNIFNNDRDNSSGQGYGTDSEYVESSSGKTINTTTYARYIRMWSNGSTRNGSNHFVELKVLGKGVYPEADNVIAGVVPTSSFHNLASDKITDGVVDSINNLAATYGQPGKSFITFDLGGLQEINKIKLWHFYADTRKYHDVVVEVAQDPLFIYGVRRVFNNDTNNSLGLGAGTDSEYFETQEGKTINVNNVRARYVRFWSNGNTINNDNHYTEVQVFRNTPVELISTTSN